MPFEVAGLAGGLAGATPYGAAIQAGAGLLANENKPSNTTSGAGSYQSGPFTVGSKQVGGKGNSAGATTASASQVPAATGDLAAAANNPQTMLYLTMGGVAIAALALLVTLTGGRRHSEK